MSRRFALIYLLVVSAWMIGSTVLKYGDDYSGHVGWWAIASMLFTFGLAAWAAVTLWRAP